MERSLANLRAAGALTPEGLRTIPLAKLRRLIRPSGFYHAQGACAEGIRHDARQRVRRIARGSGCRRPRRSCADGFSHLPGVGPETADAILLYALGHAVPVADEYLRRIAERHRLLKPRSGPGQDLLRCPRRSHAPRLCQDPAPEQAQLFNEFHALTVAVGKAHCGRTARCEGCPLAGDLHRGLTAIGTSAFNRPGDRLEAMITTKS